MKYWIFIMSLVFLLQGHTTTLLSDIFTPDQSEMVTNSACHDEHSETQSKSDDCHDCYHIHTCCHAKLIESQANYELSLYMNDSPYQEFLKLYASSPVLDGPFQPPKLL